MRTKNWLRLEPKGAPLVAHTLRKLLVFRDGDGRALSAALSALGKAHASATSELAQPDAAARQAAIHRLWLAQAVPLEVARSRAASSSVIRMGYY